VCANLKFFYLGTEDSGHPSDTRILLCSSYSGTAHAMTENHRAGGRIESVRLRRMMGTGVIADSFGDARCVQSVFHGTPEVDQLEGGWVPSKILGGGYNPRFVPNSTSAHWPLAWET
jgi:hypothetical protein